MFQRSRPVVREALRMLQQEGLIETAVGSSGGAVIRGVSLKSVEEPLKNLVAMGAINLDELLEYRHINDRSCARLAAIHHTEEDAEALRQTLEGAKANLDSLFSFQEYDVAFHSALAKASHNTLASLINDVIGPPQHGCVCGDDSGLHTGAAAGDQFADLQHPLRHHGGRPRP